ncbi:MAG: tail protein X [Verrucomicrobium sp.]|nr:tail protein X [Verrucomicrobium sp.]
MTYRTKEGETVDAICYRYYGTTYSGQVEATLESNRPLDLGQYVTLPAGLLITLPDVTPKTQEVVRLFS